MKKIIIDVLKFKAKIKNSKIFSRPNAQKIKPKGETEESDDGHLIVVNDVNSGSTYKGGNYGYAGYKFLMNLAENEPAGVSPSAYVDRKAIYQKFKFVERAYTPEVAKAIKANFKFEGGSANFCSSAANSKKKSANKKYPYSWQAHHIVPQEVYRGSNDNNRVFDDEQADLIEATGYNINHGHNIIFLPGLGSHLYVAVHGLAQHVGSHPNYSKLVFRVVSDVKSKLVSELDKIKKEIEDAEKNGHKKLKFPILKALRDAEQDMWEEIVDASDESVEAILSRGDINQIMKARADWFKLG